MGVELRVEHIEVLTVPAQPVSVPIDKYKLNLNLDTELSLRPVVLRNLRKRAVFKMQEAVGRAFREEMVAGGLHRDPYPQNRPRRGRGGQQHLPDGVLRQEGLSDPVPPVLQADHGGGCLSGCLRSPRCSGRRSTPPPRHLNEYTSLDLEMGYIDSFADLMEVESGFPPAPGQAAGDRIRR